MNYLKNERGSTLAITLMILVLFTVLGFGLFTINTSASKQFNNKEQQVQARHFAEMGLLHYKSAAELIVIAHNDAVKRIKDNDSLEIEEKVAQINELNNNLCTKLTDDLLLISPINAVDPNYEITNINCNPSVDTVVDIFVESEGKSSQGKVINIGLDLSVTHPGTLKTEVENNNGENTNWLSCLENNTVCPDGNTIKEFTDISNIDKVTLKKGNITFEDSLIMNNFRVDGGNGLQMTVKKDLSIQGELDVQNHACIMVQGDFTASTKIISKNKLYLFVYGNAYLPEGFKKSDLTSSNNDIFVTGDVYIGGKKISKEELKFLNVPSSFVKVKGTTCSLPGPPTLNNPINDKLEATLITNEYIY